MQCSGMTGILPSHCGHCRHAVVDPCYSQHVGYGGNTSPFLRELDIKTENQRCLCFHLMSKEIIWTYCEQITLITNDKLSSVHIMYNILPQCKAQRNGAAARSGTESKKYRWW